MQHIRRYFYERHLFSGHHSLVVSNYYRSLCILPWYHRPSTAYQYHQKKGKKNIKENFAGHIYHYIVACFKQHVAFQTKLLYSLISIILKEDEYITVFTRTCFIKLVILEHRQNHPHTEL